MSPFADDLERLSDRDYVGEHPFEALRTISAYFNRNQENEGRELLYQVMDLGILPETYSHVLASLQEVAGIYPYVKTSDISGTAGLISYEAHRPLNSPDLVLHAGQYEAYTRLMSGENVVLSAPTSFGKSLLIDVLLLSGKYRNIVIIVPTIALIDETRRRLQNRFGADFRIITHASQLPAESNIYVLTQERYLELRQTPKIDLFVIDEFYKLKPNDKGEYDDRTVALNLACFKLAKQAAQFLFIGPNIERVDVGPYEGNIHFIRSEFRTVGTQIHRYNASGRQNEIVLDICRTHPDSTLIFCKSHNSLYGLGRYLVSAGLNASHEKATALADWLAAHYSPDWSLVDFLRAGIAIHYAALPRSISQYILHLFNQGAIRYLLCTSTIIEGVNTSARNIIVYDNKIATKKFDFFTFNNIKGRAGRMMKHLVGHVFILNSEPQEELPIVEIPAFSLPEGMPLSLAMEVEANGGGILADAETKRLRYLHAQQDLDFNVIKANTGIDPMAQIEVAKQIRAEPSKMSDLLSWSDLPRSSQLKEVSRLLFGILGSASGQGEVKSADQLMFWIVCLQNNMPNGFSGFFEALRRNDQMDRSADDLLRTALSFLRTWAEFKIPLGIQALDRIQKSVFADLHLPTGDYSRYAERIKHWFRPPAETILEEFGVPMQLTEKLGTFEPLPENIDDILLAMNRGKFGDVELTGIERDMLTFAFPKGAFLPLEPHPDTPQSTRGGPSTP